MSNVKLFKGWLTESAEAATPGPSALNWANPVKATITKAAQKGHNVIEVKSGDGRVFNYKIIGYIAGKTYAINFNWLKKTTGGGMVIGRTVQGGVEPYEVEWSDLSTILPDLTSGKSTDHGNWAAGVKFTKI